MKPIYRAALAIVRAMCAAISDFCRVATILYSKAPAATVTQLADPSPSGDPHMIALLKAPRIDRSMRLLLGRLTLSLPRQKSAMDLFLISHLKRIIAQNEEGTGQP